jgi:hypothetical protein
MVKINYEELEFDHIVEFLADNTVFAAARENGKGKMRLFLVYEDTGNIYTRNGRANSWEQIYGENVRLVTDKINAAKNNHIPVYKINGSHN